MTSEMFFLLKDLEAHRTNNAALLTAVNRLELSSAAKANITAYLLAVTHSLEEVASILETHRHD